MSVVAGPQLQGLQTCGYGSYCATPTLFGNGWNLTTINDTSVSPVSTIQYYTAHFNRTNTTSNPVAIFYPNVTLTGVYYVYIDIPGDQDGTTYQRGLINVTASLQPWDANTPLLNTPLNQSNQMPITELLYTGFISQSANGFVPSITITPAATSNSTVMVAQQIRIIPQQYYPSSSVTLSPGARAGIGIGAAVGALILIAILYYTTCCCCCCGLFKSKRSRPTVVTTMPVSEYQNISRDVERDPLPVQQNPRPTERVPQPDSPVSPLSPLSATNVSEMEGTTPSRRGNQTSGAAELVSVTSDRKVWTSSGDQPPPYSE